MQNCGALGCGGVRAVHSPLCAGFSRNPTANASLLPASAMISLMPQTCHTCLWISDDDMEFCERCGEPFDPARARAKEKSAAANGVFRSAAVLFSAFVVVAVVIRRLDVQVPELWAATKGALHVGYVWLLGPDEVYKPYLAIMLAVTAITWFVLWLLA